MIHKIEIEVGRINNVRREDLICKIFMNVIESEFHFIICSKYGIRPIILKCFSNIAWPTLEKNQIFNVYEKTK